METQHISFKEAVLAAEEAYKQGRLGAQHDTSDCLYIYPNKDMVCAIGAVLTKESRGHILHNPKLNEKTTKELVETGLVQTEQLPLITLLQDVHDAWVQDIGVVCELKNELPKWARKWLQDNNAVVTEEVFLNFLETAKKHVK